MNSNENSEKNKNNNENQRKNFPLFGTENFYPKKENFGEKFAREHEIPLGLDVRSVILEELSDRLTAFENNVEKIFDDNLYGFNKINEKHFLWENDSGKKNDDGVGKVEKGVEKGGGKEVVKEVEVIDNNDRTNENDNEDEDTGSQNENENENNNENEKNNENNNNDQNFENRMPTLKYSLPFIPKIKIPKNENKNYKTVIEKPAWNKRVFPFTEKKNDPTRIRGKNSKSSENIGAFSIEKLRSR